MTNARKARLYAWLRLIIGGLAMGHAGWWGSRWSLAFTSFAYGATVAIIVFSRGILWGKP